MTAKRTQNQSVTRGQLQRLKRLALLCALLATAFAPVVSRSAYAEVAAATAPARPCTPAPIRATARTVRAIPRAMRATPAPARRRAAPSARLRPFTAGSRRLYLRHHALLL